MIEITVKRKDGKIRNLSVIGHANSAPNGKDLVCASVSSIVFGGFNALSNPECFTFKKDEGFVEINELKHANEHDYDVLDTIVIQLKSVEETSSKFIKVIEKGN